MWEDVHKQHWEQCPRKGPEIRISRSLNWPIVKDPVSKSRLPFLDLDRVATFVNVSHHQILRILALHRRTGQVKKAIDWWKLGRRRHLTCDDVAVSSIIIIPTHYLINQSTFTEPWIRVVMHIWMSYSRDWRRHTEFQSHCLPYGGPWSVADTPWRRYVLYRYSYPSY